ncbi:MAG: DNA polymerase III subunit gamma/tau, partial [Flavobacteriia bacterium]|nr:DNA polymerase III subunit gamma/tau [Flavobacteriia bacterium]
SIKTKKEHLIKQMDVIVNEEDLPKEGFTESQLIESWNTYIKNLQDNGKHNLASILSIDTPKVKGTTVYLEFPNSTNKVELERQQYELLSFLRKSLNNFDIDFSISVNEEKEKQYAYTAKEKFEKLKEKNPNIELLRKTFDLDI